MTMQNIRRETTSENICVLTFDRQGSSANIFDRETLLELESHIDAIWNEKPRGLVITSAKDSIFIAGADLNALAGLHDEELKGYITLGQAVFTHIAELKIPTVAAWEAATSFALHAITGLPRGTASRRSAFRR